MEPLAYLVVGIAIGVFFDKVVVGTLQTLQFFASHWRDFSADDTYADASLARRLVWHDGKKETNRGRRLGTSWASCGATPRSGVYG